MKHLQKFITSALLAMVSTIMCAQKIEVSGTVVDPNGETIIGASIMEKGTTNGTVTDFDGKYANTKKYRKSKIPATGVVLEELDVEASQMTML